MAVTRTIHLKKPHCEKQRLMIESPDNITAFCGRRFGKTDAYVQRLFYWMQRNPGLYWWVGLSWTSASMKRAWREVTAISRQVLTATNQDIRLHINRSRSEIRLPGLGEIWFRSAENPTALAGEGIRGVVVDEFSLMSPLIWTEYLEATLLDFGGWAAFGGVPKGQNWAANLWGAAPGRPGWLQIHATSYENPFIDKARIDEIQGHTAERFFNQEYLAQVIDDAGSVFRGVMECATGAPQEPIEGRQYIFGVDWGKHNDYTVITVLDTDEKRVAWIDRFNQIDYRFQCERLRTLYDKFKPYEIIAESNAMGEPLIEQLQMDGLPVTAFNTTNASKVQIIESLALAFERREIVIHNDPTLIGELQSFELTRLPSGASRYAAPEGMHDDMVMSLALAWSGIGTGGWVTLLG